MATFTDGFGGDVQTYCDTQLSSSSPTTNYGTGQTSNIGSLGGGVAQRMLLKFNVSSLIGKTITSAKLYLTPNAIDTPGTLDAYNIKVANSWTEAGATWNHAVEDTVEWAGGNNGCGVSGTDHDTNKLFNSIGSWVAGTTKEIVLDTVRVTEWLSGNYGFVIKSNDEVNWNIVQMASSDHPTEAYRPVLVIEYGEGGTTTITVTVADDCI